MKKLALYLAILCSVTTLKADIPKFDVFRILIGTDYYYYKMETQGAFDSIDLCYLPWQKEMEAYNFEDLFTRTLRYSDTTVLYKELHTVSLNKILNDEDEINLYILKNKVKLATKSIINNFSIVEATHGNTYGYIYSPDLGNADTTWIEDYPIEKTFNLHDGELCQMEFYNIQGNLRPNEKWKIRWKLTLLLRKNNVKAFDEELRKLHKRNIIMIGFCSC